VLVVAAVLAADVVALRRVGAVVARAGDMEMLEDLDAEGPAKAVDLGLGDALRGEIARGDAYRGRAQTDALVRGDSRQAVAVVRRATRRGAAFVVALVAVVAIHARASRPDVELAFDDELCRRGDGGSCRDASFLLRLDPPDDLRAASYDVLGCERNDAASCVLAAEHAAATHEPALELERHNRACRLGHRPSCLSADGLTLRPGRMGPRQLADFCAGHDIPWCLRRHLIDKPPVDEGVLLAARRCIDGVNMDCDAVGTALTDTDPPGAVLARVRACELGLAYNCYLAGMLLANGVSIPSAAALSPILLERSCIDEPGFACCEAAYSYVMARDTPMDLVRGRDLYRRAASAGYGAAGACDVIRKSQRID
jgi:hypothetical protein